MGGVNASTGGARPPQQLLCRSFSSSSCHQHHSLINPTKKKLLGSQKFLLNTPNLSSKTSRLKRSLSPHASNSQNRQETPGLDDTTSIVQEDAIYLLKLGAGSVAGAAVIKYGSIIFPEITRPNMLQALIMISTPVIVASLLLIRQSRLE